jgi:predicted transcriptional regulator YdeE
LAVGRWQKLKSNPDLSASLSDFHFHTVRQESGLANDQRPSAKGQRPKENTITRADLPGFLIIGIEARTTNAKEATADGAIPAQWQRFFQEGILSKIPGKIGSNIYALYTDYASDRNDEYSFMIGAMVKDGTTPTPGLVAKHVSGGQFAVFTTDQGPLPQVVPGAWQKLWKLEDEGKFKRAYKTDFELYDQRAQDPQNAQVDIYIGLK